MGQLYPDWELCIAYDAARTSVLRETLGSFVQDSRIRLIPVVDGMLAGALTTASSSTACEFVAFLECDDLLAEHALYWVAKELIEQPDTHLLFSDEDKISARGARFDPYFKPDWNPALMLSCDAFGGLGVFRKTLLEKAGGFRCLGSPSDGIETHDLVLRCARETRPERIRHIPRVLYHRRAHHATKRHTSGEAAERTAIEDYLVSAGVCGIVTCMPRPSSERADNREGFYQVEYQLPSPAPLVSVVIATTGIARTIEPCIQSIRTFTTYKNFEILLLVNERHRKASDKVKLLDLLAENPRLRVLVYPDRPFNYSWVNNWGARQASGDLLCFLNDDTTVITPQWLDRLAARAMLPGVAAAGPLLIHPDGTIQHAGVILGLSGVAGHASSGEPRGSWGYFGRARLEQDVSCVTAACMMIRADVFRELKGFDEELAIAYNDVDLCVRLRRAGWRIIFTPAVELYHHESASTGRHDSAERAAEYAREVAVMRKRWGPLLDADPFYNPNLSLKRQYDLAFPPRLDFDWSIRKGIEAHGA
jgi:GT2 family glycosyltransferase